MKCARPTCQRERFRTHAECEECRTKSLIIAHLPPREVIRLSRGERTLYHDPAEAARAVRP